MRGRKTPTTETDDDADVEAFYASFGPVAVRRAEPGARKRVDSQGRERVLCGRRAKHEASYLRPAGRLCVRYAALVDADGVPSCRKHSRDLRRAQAKQKTVAARADRRADKRARARPTCPECGCGAGTYCEMRWEGNEGRCAPAGDVADVCSACLSPDVPRAIRAALRGPEVA